MEKKMKVCRLIAELICKTTDEEPNTTAIAETLAEIEHRAIKLRDKKLSAIVDEVNLRVRNKFFIRSGEYITAELKAIKKIEQENENERRSNENTANKNTQI